MTKVRIHIGKVDVMNVGCSGVTIAGDPRRLSSKIDDDLGDYASRATRARKASKSSEPCSVLAA